MHKHPKDTGFIAIRFEGGILPPEFLQSISRLEAKWQKNTDYRLTKSLNLKDEIGRYWRMAADLWSDYQQQRDRHDIDARKVGVDQWLIPFLSEVLGFHDISPTGGISFDDRHFPIEHQAIDSAVPLVLTTRDYDLDRADVRFGEEGRRRAPHGLLQEYLNAADACLWGMVSNGRTLRLLRDNPSLTRPAYVEVDLEQIFEEQLFADFAAFWLLFHTTRLTPRDGSPFRCILEAWRTVSHETGERAREKLRLGVTEAIRTLGNGFLEHPENNTLRQAFQDGELTALHYFQELLRLIYRFLFLFTAEDRQLLFPPDIVDAERQLYAEGYSLSHLRDRALKRRHYDHYTDLWAGLQITFRGLQQGAMPLGLPALGGLFEAAQCPRLDACAITNAHLLSALRALTFFQSGNALVRVNYRDMGTEELGSVYESLLELQPAVEVSPWRFLFLGDVQEKEGKGSQRKFTGSYYTPPALVEELIKSALVPVIEQTIRDNPKNPRQALLSLSIVDPACGSGHFLLAAARRLAAEIAKLEAGQDTPDEALRQHALRETVQHCIHGVDRNPLAVELCKSALWMETVEPGKPLTFLDAHIRCGDSLVGVMDPGIMDEGIPDEAYQPLTGDDKTICQNLKKANKSGKKGGIQSDLFDENSLKEVATTAAILENLPEETLADIEVKRKKWQEVEQDTTHQQQLLKANLFAGAFFAPKTAENAQQVSLTEDLRRVSEGLLPRTGLQEAVTELATEHRFFHWHLAFPDVFAQGGFDVVLGNPPWERIKLQEQEFFAVLSPEIAGASNKAARDQLIKALTRTDSTPAQRALYRAYLDAKHEAEAASSFVRRSGRFPLTAFGDVNLYALFAELFYRLKLESGRAGIIVPSGIATDDSTKTFFGEITDGKQLVSLFDFENREAIFTKVHRSFKFSLLTLGSGSLATRFVFFATSTEHLVDKQRQFTLSAEDIVLINPNTRTCPVFRSSADAELTKKIYRRVPVLINESKGDKGNPWDIRFMTMFHMSNDSYLFKTAADLSAEGAQRDGANWSDGNEVWVPLYEAKMIHQYDHRWATYEADGTTSRDVTVAERAGENFHVMPRYWVPQKEVEERLASKDWKQRWLMGWRDITNATNERTIIAGVVPRVGIGNKIPLIFPSANLKPLIVTCLIANLTTIALDFAARQKIGGTTLNFFYIKQFPVLPPTIYTSADCNFITSRVLELVYTAQDMKPFAEDLGYFGPPFPFDPDRRALLRAELDAYYTRLYSLTRDDLRYILDPADVYGEDFPSETFRVLKKNEMKEFGEYRTRRLVLEAWDKLESENKESVPVTTSLEDLGK